MSRDSRARARARTSAPLAISKALLDVARTDPNHDTGELVARLHTVTTRAIDLTEALLLVSRTERQSFTREAVDVSLMAEEATETLLPLTEQHGVTIETGGDIAPTRGSRALLLQLTMNLVHNAIVHNLPERGAVWVRTAVKGGDVNGGDRPTTVALTVENTGERLTAELASTLAEPFRRGTERVHTDHAGAGAGLGLAIVKTVAHAHDGTLTVTPRSVGGISVTVELPAVCPPRA